MDKENLNSSIRQYIRDHKYLSNENNNLEMDESEYLRAKNRVLAIKEYSKTHKLFFMYLFNKISIGKLGELLGYGERQIFRYLNTQRSMFIDYMTAKEEQIDEDIKTLFEH